MADHDRGAYTPPTDAPLSFDARAPVRGARPIPFTLIISALVLVGLVVAIVMFYRSGVREAGQPPQTVGAPIGDIKQAAAPEAQPQDPAAGLQIYKSENGAADSGAAPTFTAPPEQPQARPAPAPVVVTPPAPAPVTTASLRPALPAAPVAAPAKPAAVAPPPKSTAPHAPDMTLATETPRAKPAVPAPKAAAPEPVRPAGPVSGAVVQIGAVSSTALADKAWSDAVAAAPGLAAGKGKSVEKIDKNGATLYRTAVTGFADRAAATAFCNKLKAAGKNCFVR